MQWKASEMTSSAIANIPSLWREMSGARSELPSLQNDRDTDVVIVGGGYTGLAAAHRLIERGVAPVVLEANRIGWGASGRNGGVVSAKVRQSFPAIATQHGLETARSVHRLCHTAVDELEALIDSLGLTQAGFRRCGNLRCAHHERAFKSIADEAEWLQRALGDGDQHVLSAEAVRDETGSRAFFGGVLSEGVGTLLPLAYVEGLAEVLVKRHGLALFERTPATGIRRTDGGVRVITPGGEVRARQVILATNAYSGQTEAGERIRTRMVPFRSSIIATEPLPPALQQRLLVNNRSYGETRRMMRWFRKVDGRFLFGGRGAFGKHDSRAAFDALQRSMISLFPDLADVKIAYRWSGHVGMTLDAIPHVGRFDDRMVFAAGYNGAGVSLSNYLGRLAADFSLGENPDVSLLGATNFRRVPCYPLREFGIRLTAGWYQLLDAMGR